MRFLPFILLILFLYGPELPAQNLTRAQRIEIEFQMKIVRNSIDPSEIINLTNKILKTDTSYSKAIFYRAYANYFKKDYAASLIDYNTYFKKHPTSISYTYRARVKLQLGDTLGAISDIEKDLFLSGYDSKVTDKAATFLPADQNTAKFYEKILQFHPHNFTAYLVLGIINEKNKNYKEAAKNYEMALKYFKDRLFEKERYDYRWIFGQIANLNFKLKNYNTAIEVISYGILLHPDEGIYYNQRIKYYLAINEKTKACADLWQLEKSGIAPFPYESKCDSTIAANKPSKEWLRDIEAEKFYLQGCSIPLLDTTNCRKAIYFYSKTLELNPNHIYALGARSHNYCGINQIDKQIKDLNKILQLNPKLAEALNRRAGAKRDIGSLKEALLDANNAIILDSVNVNYWTTRASIKTRLGDTASALSDLSKAIEINPYYSIAYAERGIIRLGLRDEAQAALKDNLKALDLDENNPFSNGFPTYYNNCAMSYNRLNIYDKALENIDKAIALNPNYALYYYRSGEIKARMKNMKGACEDWNKAKQLGYKDAEEVIMYNCK